MSEQDGTLCIGGHVFSGSYGNVKCESADSSAPIHDGAPIDLAYRIAKSINALTRENIKTIANFLIDRGYGNCYVGKATVYDKIGKVHEPIAEYDAFIQGDVGVFFDDGIYLLYKDNSTLLFKMSYRSRVLVNHLRSLKKVNKKALLSWMDKMWSVYCKK